MAVVLSLAATAVAALTLAQPAVPATVSSHAALSVATAQMPSSVASSARTRRPQVLLRDLRACGKALYNASAYQCVRDERGRPLVSNGAYCTVTVYAFSAVRVRVNMTYGGQTLFARTTKVRARTALHLAVYFELPITLPAGRYACTIKAASKSVKATLTGGGAAGPVANSSVCSSTRAVANLCGADESALPVAPTTSLTCSGFFAGQKGHFGGIELLYNDNGVWTSVQKFESRLPNPITSAYLTVPSLLGQPYVPGQYSCRFTLDGQTVAEKLFSVQA